MIRFGRNHARIIRWLCNVKPETRVSVEELMTRIKLKSIRKCLQDERLQCFNHLERMEESVWSSRYRTFKISSSFSRGRPKKT